MFESVLKYIHMKYLNKKVWKRNSFITQYGKKRGNCQVVENNLNMKDYRFLFRIFQFHLKNQLTLILRSIHSTFTNKPLLVLLIISRPSILSVLH